MVSGFIKDERVILGIDPGTGRCGFALLKLKIKNEKLKIREPELLNCGLIETPVKTPLSDRLKVIYEKITELIKKYHPTEMAIEELFFVKNIKTGISVAHARGVIMLAGELAGIPVFEYKPNEIKLAIAGHGHADKSQMARMIKLHLKNCEVPRSGLKQAAKWDTVKQDDAVDAVAVAVTHLQIRKFKI